jgi:hypothetical protein
MSITRDARSQITHRRIAFLQSGPPPPARPVLRRPTRWHGGCFIEDMPTAKKKKPPWERANPKAKERTTSLTGAQKSKAKASAKRAGRRYPNLVDNMNAARKKRTKGTS